MKNRHKKIFLELNPIPRINFLNNRDVKSYWHWKIYISENNSNILYAESIEDKQDSKKLTKLYIRGAIPSIIERLIIILLTSTFIIYSFTLIDYTDIVKLIPIFIIDMGLVYLVTKYVFRPINILIGSCIDGKIFLNNKLPDKLKDKIKEFTSRL